MEAGDHRLVTGDLRFIPGPDAVMRAGPGMWVLNISIRTTYPFADMFVGCLQWPCKIMSDAVGEKHLSSKLSPFGRGDQTFAVSPMWVCVVCG